MSTAAGTFAGQFKSEGVGNSGAAAVLTKKPWFHVRLNQTKPLE